MYNLTTNIESCYYVLPNLLYYSHIPVVLVTLFLGIFVYIKNKTLTSKILLFISLLFSAWTVLNLIVWISVNSFVITSSWALFGIITALLFISSIYFVQVYITKKDVGIKTKIIWSILLLPLIIFIKLAAENFNLSNCEVVENNYYTYYYYAVGVISFLWILIFAVSNYFKTIDKEIKKQIIYLTIGISAFLISFFITGFLSSYLDNFDLEQYGLFGMVIFMGYLAFIIVRFNAFDIKLLGAQALVWSTIILIGSQFFFIQSDVNRILNAFTLVISTIVGLMIVRSVKKEVAQREQIEQLAGSLEKSNDQLADTNLSLQNANEKLKELDQLKTEFVSLATHQIRGPLGAIKGYISLITEGDYGPLPENLREPMDTIFKSTDSLSKIVTDFLDVTRIEQGQMKYEMTEFDLRDLVNEVVNELKPNIEAHKLELRTDISNHFCWIKADRNKLKQVFNNLLDNSTKYTKTGWIEVSVKDEIKFDKVLFAIKDSGVGISPETLPLLFQKFSRASDASKANILGTGLGLYVARKMMEAHHGKVWAESEGQGKGSQFYVELDLVK